MRKRRIDSGANNQGCAKVGPGHSKPRVARGSLLGWRSQSLWDWGKESGRRSTPKIVPPAQRAARRATLGKACSVFGLRISAPPQPLELKIIRTRPCPARESEKAGEKRLPPQWVAGILKYASVAIGGLHSSGILNQTPATIAARRCSAGGVARLPGKHLKETGLPVAPGGRG